ncbi:enoyl-CoA hydratase [Acuticoccus sediminis]|uniref:Enoyl-CoA hydratase n=1 Tax=Acuticoccus sediminis TaxID=2184697 RepID=A0A8B2NP59_9HYPH|nr:crotonase/enoyl-CoA hydratase family protein [Acuticoccus sediminis]RAH98869.1 enoyl-CoA hydratase [Acuticoccus sediminis]
MDSLPGSLSLTVEDEVAILTLSRPEKRNALNMETVAGLAAFFAAPPEGVKAAVLDAAGPHFCAGLDLSEMTSIHTPMASVTHSRAWHRAFHEIEFGMIPVVSVMHGAVVGGGLELAASTHVRVAEASAYYGLPEGQRGLFLGGGGSVRISRLIGAHRVMELMLTGRTLSSEEGLALGLSHYRVADGEGRALAVDLARRIASNSAESNFAIIQSLPRIAASAPETGLMMESLTASFAEGSPETQARLAAFLEKRAGKVTRD